MQTLHNAGETLVDNGVKILQLVGVDDPMVRRCGVLIPDHVGVR